MALATENGLMSSVANMRDSQWLPCTKHEVVSWFSISAPVREGQPKKARAASATRGVTMRATQYCGVFVEPPEP